MTLRLLASYHYYRRLSIDTVAERLGLPDVPVLADSGAFTAWSLGVPITVAEYATWLERWHDRLDGYANLDVIGSAAGTLTNQSELEALGFRPIPVFHFGDPWSYLEHYLDGYPRIMLGGMVSPIRSWRTVMPWAIRCFHLARGRVCLHGLGASAKPMLESLPFYSYDSGSWLSGSRYRSLSLWDEQETRWTTLALNKTEHIERSMTLLHSYGVTAREALAWRGTGGGSTSVTLWTLGAAAWIRYERHIRRIHGPVPGTGLPGPNSYLANNPTVWVLMDGPDILRRAAGSVYA